MIDITEANNKFALSLLQHRQQLGMGVAEFAEACGLHRHSVYLYEKGSHSPTLYSMLLIAEFLHISLDELAGVIINETDI